MRRCSCTFVLLALLAGALPAAAQDYPTRPIRNMLPSLGGIDVSPVVVILIIILIKDIIVRYIYPSVF